MPITQSQVDSERDRLIALSLAWEKQRDAAPYESQSYWNCHDIAVLYRQQAEALMP